MMQRFRTPTLDTPEKLKYYLEQFGLYYAGGEKMKEVTIGGIPMYDIFDKSDPSEGLSYGYKKYIAQLNDHEILFMSIQTPTYDESLFQKAKEKLDDFLQTIQFTPTQVFTPVETIEFNDPAISLTASEENDTPLNR